MSTSVRHVVKGKQPNKLHRAARRCDAPGGRLQRGEPQTAYTHSTRRRRGGGKEGLLFIALHDVIMQRLPPLWDREKARAAVGAMGRGRRLNIHSVSTAGRPSVSTGEPSNRFSSSCEVGEAPEKTANIRAVETPSSSPPPRLPSLLPFGTNNKFHSRRRRWWWSSQRSPPHH